ncbi:penicillin acylase family protein [Sphingomonas sp.]|uniref:penicillin acylase family protein n=1 Tax=Sphingomonas sp. TaxID=28214 RepID=UPI00286CA492|nr:penicillin acylase family protein [Sphingomonas sp.]
MKLATMALLGALISSTGTAAIPTAAQRLAQRAATITIARDQWGIAHIRGRTDADAIFGMAYAQAEDDFNRVETNYLTSLGRLAEAEGDAAIWKDLRQRLWIDEADLKVKYSASPTWLRQLMQGWADGLNFYLASHPAVRPRVLTRFEPWMALSFSEGSIGGDIEYVDLDALRALYDRAAPHVASAKPWSEPQGSNGIAIGPSRSTSGNPLLLINPHTSFFFRDVVQVTSGEGLNVYGAVTWGQFFVYQGFNARAGWMHTTSGLDNRDEYAETFAKLPNGKLGYRFGGDLRPVAVKPVTIRIRAADGGYSNRAFSVMKTMHGPIIRSGNGKFIAFAILDDPAHALEQSFKRTKAGNLDEFMRASALRANSSNNTLFADSSGNIAYLHPQFVPLRDDRFDYRGVVSGGDPRTLWRGLTASEGLPNIVNPKSGFVFNSNDAPWSAAGTGSLDPAKFPRYMDQYGANARTDHALRLLDGAGKFTTRSLNAAAYDRDNPGFDRILPGLIATYDGLRADHPRRASLAEPIAMLRAWDRRWSADSAALTLGVHWGEAIWDEVMGKDRPSNAYEIAYARIIAASPERKLAALEQALAALRGLYGTWQLPWGEINRFQRNDGAITQTFDDKKPSLAVPFPSARWGSLAAFEATTYPGTAKRYGTKGNSFIAVVEFTSQGPRAFAVTAGGVNGDPNSPHFLDQAQDYAAGRLNPIPFTDAEVARAAVETYRPGEARRTR